MLNSKSQASTTANSSTKDDVIPSSPTCTKPLVGRSFVYSFNYCPCKYESAFATISLHKSLQGAYSALKKHKLNMYNEWLNSSRFYRSRFKFGDSKMWSIDKVEIFL